MEISHILQSWYQDNHRDLPWRETHDAYRIWLSEIILQQTRVVQGLDYYLRFVKAFPTVTDLANATQDDVLKLWQGLGYYSRARNLHYAAQQVVTEFKGTFPTHYEDVRRLKGVGPYTAAAIASFSSDEAVAVVDGNVYRVLSRLFDIDTPIDSTAGQKEFLAVATELLDTHHAGTHNQAIMEFGALHCTPATPQCDLCPLREQCLAWANGTIASRPVKANKVKVRERHLDYIIYKYKDNLWVHQRGAGDIWQGLWEYVLIDTTLTTTNSPLSTHNFLPSFTLRHQLTHQTLICRFQVIEVQEPITHLPAEYICISWEEWQQKAVSRLIVEANQRLAPLFQ